MARPLREAEREPIIEELMIRLAARERLPTHLELSKEYGVSHPTISNYLREAYRRMPRKSIEQRMHEIQEDFDYIKNMSHRHLEKLKKDPKLFKEFAEHHMKIIKEETDFLERFHIKAKAIERLEIRDEKQLIIDNFEDVVDAEVKEIENETV